MTVTPPFFRSSRNTPRYRTRLGLETLETRDQPSAGTVDLGAAAQFGVLGLTGVQIANGSNSPLGLLGLVGVQIGKGATVGGDMGVSSGGGISNANQSTITGTVEEYTAGQYSGRGSAAAVVANSGLMDKADADALGASAAAAALLPTQAFQAITAAQTVNGNGGLNVISINGSISASLTLKGSASDVFIVNVTGGLNLGGSSTLALAGGVTANHVMYNFVGNQGSITTSANSIVNGTLLGPKLSVDIAGTVNGEVIGGVDIKLRNGAAINAISFVGVHPAADASISGTVFDDASRDGVKDPGEAGIAGVTVTLTGTDSAGHAVSLTTTTAADGTYTFAGLSAGTYSLSRTTPRYYDDGACLPGTDRGTTDGTAGASSIDQIKLNGGDAAVNYDFAELMIPIS